MTPAYRLAATPTLGCPLTHPSSASAMARSFPATGSAIGAQRGGKGRRMASNGREPLLHKVGRPRQKLARVMFSNAAFGQNVFLERVEPVVENGP